MQNKLVGKILRNTDCSGTQNGNTINTTARRDFLGNDLTSGTVNGKRFNQACRTDFLGNYVCK